MTLAGVLTLAAGGVAGLLILAAIVGCAVDDYRTDRASRARAAQLRERIADGSLPILPWPDQEAHASELPETRVRAFPRSRVSEGTRSRVPARLEGGSISVRLSWRGALVAMALSAVTGIAAWSGLTGWLPDLPSLPDGNGAPADRHDQDGNRDDGAGNRAGNGSGTSARQLRADLAAVTVVDERPYVPGYDRDAAFGSDWATTPDGCDVRQQVLARDLTRETFDDDGCTVLTGTLNDPYTGQRIQFTRDDALAVQIDHVYPLAAAWAAGASQWSDAKRLRFANDPRNLIAVDGPTNASKSDSTPGEWMPPNDAYACTYHHRFLTVAADYGLPITEADADEARTTAEEGCGRGNRTGIRK